MQKKKKNYLKVESNCFLVARARKKKKKSIYYNLCTKEAVEGNDDDGEEG